MKKSKLQLVLVGMFGLGAIGCLIKFQLVSAIVGAVVAYFIYKHEPKEKQPKQNKIEKEVKKEQKEMKKQMEEIENQNDVFDFVKEDHKQLINEFNFEEMEEDEIERILEDEIKQAFEIQSLINSINYPIDNKVFHDMFVGKWVWVNLKCEVMTEQYGLVIINENGEIVEEAKRYPLEIKVDMNGVYVEKYNCKHYIMFDPNKKMIVEY